MANKISQVAVGKSAKRFTKHDKRCLASTTLNFGEVAPLGCFPMDGDTKLSGSVSSLVRMPPLPRPTFGRLSYNIYSRFVPVRDVYRNFENLRTARSLTTQFGTFTPQCVPYLTCRQWSAMILSRFCKFNLYRGTYDGSHQFDTQTEISLLNAKNIVDNSSIDRSSILSQFNSFLGTTLTSSDEYKLANRARVNQNLVYINEENADFVFYIPNTTTPTDSYMICFRLTRLGKLFYRHYVGLGGKFDCSNSTRRISVLPFLAFYKGYFELFVPANNASSNRNYTDTNAFRLADYCAEHDVQLLSADANAYSLFESFISDLSRTFYYQKPDYLTSCVSTPTISPATRVSVPYNAQTGMSSITGSQDIGQTALQQVGNDPNSLAIMGIDGNGGSIFNNPLYSTRTHAIALKVLLKMLPYLNKDTVIGGQIRKLIRSRYGYDVETLEGQSYSAGYFELPIDISAITNSSDTRVAESNSGQQLGWQAGQGIGFNQRDSKGKLECLRINFNANEPGYLMFYAVVVPDVSFYQGVHPHVSYGTNGRFSIFDAEFDSLGFDIVTKDVLMGQNLVDVKSNSRTFLPKDFGKTGFGYSPRYFDRKLAIMDMISGDLNRLCYREQYAPYYLNRMISENDVARNTEVNSSGTELEVTYFRDNRVNLPSATPELRQLGYEDWLANLNRIFYVGGLINRAQNLINVVPSVHFMETFGVDDNFICDNYLDLDYFDHSLPSKLSFDTDGGGNDMDVQHA